MLLNVARTAVSVVLPSKLSSDTSSTDAITRNRAYKRGTMLTERMLSREMLAVHLLTLDGADGADDGSRAAAEEDNEPRDLQAAAGRPGARADDHQKHQNHARQPGQRLKSTVP